jgi:cytochrome oxidase Cu insertion factor (SCO1/SenC/PrrC family)
MKSNTSISFASCAIVLSAALFASASLAPTVRAQTGQTAPAQSKEQTTTAAAEYACPMHPSVRSKSPGKCPKCKMNLRLVKHEDAEHDAHKAAGAQSATPAPVVAKYGGGASSSRMAIPDVELLDQDGRKIHFYSDLVKDKVVAINFIFTTCTTICPPLGATFARVQKELGERAGRDVHFISISVDPVTDTPERLKAWGAKFKAGASWTFVTGSKPQVDELLRSLSASSASREDHSPTVLIGNEARGQWTRTYGLAKPSQLVSIINDAIAGNLEPSSKEGSK